MDFEKHEGENVIVVHNSDSSDSVGGPKKIQFERLPDGRLINPLTDVPFTRKNRRAMKTRKAKKARRVTRLTGRDPNGNLITKAISWSTPPKQTPKGTPSGIKPKKRAEYAPGQDPLGKLARGPQ